MSSDPDRDDEAPDPGDFHDRFSDRVELPFGKTDLSSDFLTATIGKDAISELERFGVDNPEYRLEKFVDTVALLLDWVEEHGRVFPWRMTVDPWRVYSSEVLLKKTRADAVASIYDGFYTAFPGPRYIREASDEEIKAEVRSLGLENERLKTLRSVADHLAEYGDEVPESEQALREPWGVGRYAARATLIFAFGNSMGLVDTNFERVLGRVFDLSFPTQPHKDDRVHELYDALAPDDPGVCRAYSLAILDIGSLVCTPSSPACASCPLEEACHYAAPVE